MLGLGRESRLLPGNTVSGASAAPHDERQRPLTLAGAKHQHHTEETLPMKNALKKLAQAGIVTLADVDTWASSHVEIDKWGRHYIPSRFQVLTLLAGENAAINILHELATRQCCNPVGNH